MRKGIAIYFVLFAILISCKKEDPLPTELPPITTEGKNTFGCLINGEIYVPEIRRISFSVPITMEFPQNPNFFFRVNTIRLVNEDDNVQDAEVIFAADSVLSTGIYQFSQAVVLYNNIYYQSDTLHSGVLNISRFDSLNGVISGTFNFEAIDWLNTNSQIIQVSSGRFDLKN